MGVGLLAVMILPRPMWPCCGESVGKDDVPCCESICDAGHPVGMDLNRRDAAGPVDPSPKPDSRRLPTCTDCIAPCCAKIVAQTGPTNAFPAAAQIGSVCISSETRPDGSPADGVFHPPRCV
jgi:hypothetical protein